METGFLKRHFIQLLHHTEIRDFKGGVKELSESDYPRGYFTTGASF
jgi:hypothetical protein